MFEIIASSTMFIKVTWYIALTTTLIFMIQVGMTFIGGDHDTDHDIDHDIDHDTDSAQHDTGASFQWFTFKNLIAFLMFFAWGVIGTAKHGDLFAIITGLICGISMVVIMTLLYHYMKKLQTDNVPEMNSIIGKSCTVYLRVPANGTGMGKITVELNGSLQTIDAEAMDKEIPTGFAAKVIGLKAGRIAIITKI